MENGHHVPEDEEGLSPDPESDVVVNSLRQEFRDTISTTGHKRSLSGSILSKLSFLRSTTEGRETSKIIAQTDGIQEDVDSQTVANTTTSTGTQKKTRKRKGSLRKTAILGTGRLKLEGREKRASPLETVESVRTDGSQAANGPTVFTDSTSPDIVDELVTPRPSFEDSSKPNVTKPQTITRSLDLAHEMGSDDSLPLTSLSRRSTLGDMSTTDEDDALTFSTNTSLSNNVPTMKKPTGNDSYFPVVGVGVGLQRRRSANKAKSPLASLPLEPLALPEEWDYSDTEWWGWVVLGVTWIVVVVGMGSCFGVWSWAWDVGETPYAPPELEDDPTLPIVGYYPALIILTAVMAWVWVVVAWVGMKYFKHAKISGEDT